MQVGHRFERTEVLSAVVPSPAIQDEWNKLLFEAAKIPGGRTIISAPFVQLIRDTRDSAFDPTRGTFFSARVDLANQLFGTSTNSSFVKLDVRQQWNWPMGRNADRGVAALGVRLGVAHPTARSAEEFPLSERFFAGGPFTHRGVEPDQLGPRGNIPLLDPDTGNFKTTPTGNRIYQLIPVGGQGLALVNLEYRFPVWGQTIWAEVFVDSGQVYRSFRATDNDDPSAVVGAAAPFPPFRTALGVGLIIKLGLPIKIEYAADVKKILGRNRSREDRETELQGVLISAGFQF
jgi:outer membrane protein assembly factor BamA